MRLTILAAIALSVSAASAVADNSKYFVEVYKYAYAEPSVMTKDSEIGFIGLGYQNYGAQDEDGIISTARLFIGTTKYASTSTGTTTDDLTTGFSSEVAYKKESFFVGLGYRYLFDKWGDKQSSTGAYTYNRKSQYLYMPVGIIRYNEKGGYLKTQFNYLLGGTQTSYLTRPGYTTTTNKQKSGYGLEVEYAPNSKYSIFAKHWSINKSTINNGLFGVKIKF